MAGGSGWLESRQESMAFAETVLSRIDANTRFSMLPHGALSTGLGDGPLVTSAVRQLALGHSEPAIVCEEGRRNVHLFFAPGGKNHNVTLDGPITIIRSDEDGVYVLRSRTNREVKVRICENAVFKVNPQACTANYNRRGGQGSQRSFAATRVG